LMGDLETVGPEARKIKRTGSIRCGI
jgi:hypothetical protein